MLSSLIKKVMIEEKKTQLSKKKKSDKNCNKVSKKNIEDKKVKTVKGKGEVEDSKSTDIFNRFITKVNVTYFILFLLDIGLVIYFARQNIVNYVTVWNQDIFVSKTKYLLFGRNYINLIIIGFFYLYICLINRFFLKRKNTKRFLGWLLVILAGLNIGLFVLFTKRVY